MKSVSDLLQELGDSNAKLVSTLGNIEKALGASGCAPGVEYQSGKDKDGNALCKYLTQPCNTFYDRTKAIMFEKTAASRTSDRVCSHYTPIPDGQFLVVAGGAFKDNVYKKFTVCTKGKEWESVAPTPTSNRECTAITDCKKIGKTEYIAATPTSDAKCATKGQAKDVPARDCVEIKQLYSKFKSAYFYVDGKGHGVRKVWCDQDTAGGGWMLVGYVGAGPRCVCTPKQALFY